MKVKVLTSFRDKENKKVYKKDEVIDVTVKRFNEITTKGRYIQPVEENETKQTKA